MDLYTINTPVSANTVLMEESADVEFAGNQMAGWYSQHALATQ